MTHPWERQPDESAEAYSAFCAYRDLGEGRSIDQAYRGHQGHHEGTKRAPGRWKGWSVRYLWGQRAAAWDARDQHIAQQAHEAVVATDAAAKTREALRSQRRVQQEEDEWALRCQILEVGRKLLARVATPVMHRRGVYYKGHKLEDLEIRRHRWNASSLAKLLTVAKDLGRLSAQMPCTISQVEPPADAAGLKELLFASDGQFEAALPEGVVQPMPLDVLTKPTVNAGQPLAGPGATPLTPPKARPT